MFRSLYAFRLSSVTFSHVDERVIVNNESLLFLHLRKADQESCWWFLCWSWKMMWFAFVLRGKSPKRLVSWAGLCDKSLHHLMTNEKIPKERPFTAFAPKSIYWYWKWLGKTQLAFSSRLETGLWMRNEENEESSNLSFSSHFQSIRDEFQEVSEGTFQLNSISVKSKFYSKSRQLLMINELTGNSTNDWNQRIFVLQLACQHQILLGLSF